MPKADDYTSKFESFKQRTLYPRLDSGQQAFLRRLAHEHRFTFQEFRQVVEASRDLNMWQEAALENWWGPTQAMLTLQGPQLKKRMLRQLQEHLDRHRTAAKVYPDAGLSKPREREKKFVSIEPSTKTIEGMCPVASEETVCCNLRTIDAVENCAFGCSYCTIQTFYNDTFVFDSDFAQKLRAIDIEPDRFYHFGTGQSSDSLVWGNKNGNLDALCDFATQHPNVLLEFKTKSDNVDYFLTREVPPNIVCSWSLNTDTIITNEEHFTANLARRLKAARQVADLGIKVAFHFHPMVYYQGWEKDYPTLARDVVARFAPDEVLFISFGSVTMIKPAIKKIRQSGHATKILQMEMVQDPHGKLTYPDSLKISMFKTMYQAFEAWQERVFFYLCMEKASIWEGTFNFAYESNDLFEARFAEHAFAKIERGKQAA